MEKYLLARNHRRQLDNQVNLLLDIKLTIIYLIMVEDDFLIHENVIKKCY